MANQVERAMRAITWAALLLAMCGARAGAQPPDAPPPPVSLRLSSEVLEEGGQVAVDVVLSPAPARDLSAQFFLTSPTQQHDILQAPFLRLASSMVTIRAGQTEARVLLRAPDDGLRYDQERIGISVYVSGLSGPDKAFATLAYHDNDPLKLSLQTNGSVWREGASHDESLLAVSSNGRGSFTEVKLSSNRPDVIETPDRTFSVGNSTGSGMVRVVERPGVDPPTPVTLTASGPGLEPVEVKVIVVDSSSRFLSVRFWPPWIDEDATTPARGLVMRSGDLSKPLHVTLDSSNSRLVRLPASVTIPARTDRAVFEVSPIEVREVDPRQYLPAPAQRFPDATIWASDASGDLASGRAVLHVRDTTPVIEAIATPARFAEEDAPAKGILSLRLARPRAQDVEVTLVAKDKRIVLASTSALLPRRGRAVSVPFEVADDSGEGNFGLSDIQVHDGFIRAFDGLPTPATVARVRLLDDDAPLALRLSRSMILASEGRWTLDVTAMRREPSPQPLEVKLSQKIYEHPSKITLELPPSVTIPAGQRSATVQLSGITTADVATNVSLEALSDKARTWAHFSVLGPQNMGSVALDEEVLSSAEPEHVVILSGFNSESLDFPITLQIRPEENPGLATAPMEIRLQPHQKWVAIPIKLVRAPAEDATATFTVSVSSQAPGVGGNFRVSALADPPVER